MPDLKIETQRAPADFGKWDSLLELLRTAFAYQEERIDPPSSVLSLTVDALARKSVDEHLLIAVNAGKLAGCVFVADRGTSLYVSKLAVWPHLQGQGIGRHLMQSVEDFAREAGHDTLELETRIELTENHRTFESLGFHRVSEHAHQGYDRITFVRMQRRLDA